MRIRTVIATTLSVLCVFSSLPVSAQVPSQNFATAPESVDGDVGFLLTPTDDGGFGIVKHCPPEIANDLSALLTDTRILKIDDVYTRGQSTASLQRMLKGTPGTSVQLTLLGRSSGELAIAVVKRYPIDKSTVKPRNDYLDQGIIAETLLANTNDASRFAQELHQAGANILASAVYAYLLESCESNVKGVQRDTVVNAQDFFEDTGDYGKLDRSITKFGGRLKSDKGAHDSPNARRLAPLQEQAASAIIMNKQDYEIDSLLKQLEGNRFSSYASIWDKYLPLMSRLAIEIDRRRNEKAYAEAEQLCKTMIDIYRKRLDLEQIVLLNRAFSPSLAELEERLGLIYQAEGKRDLADKCFAGVKQLNIEAFGSPEIEAKLAAPEGKTKDPEIRKLLKEAHSAVTTGETSSTGGTIDQILSLESQCAHHDADRLTAEINLSMTLRAHRQTTQARELLIKLSPFISGDELKWVRVHQQAEIALLSSADQDHRWLDLKTSLADVDPTPVTSIINERMRNLAMAYSFSGNTADALNIFANGCPSHEFYYIQRLQYAFLKARAAEFNLALADIEKMSREFEGLDQYSVLWIVRISDVFKKSKKLSESERILTIFLNTGKVNSEYAIDALKRALNLALPPSKTGRQRRPSLSPSVPPVNEDTKSGLAKVPKLPSLIHLRQMNYPGNIRQVLQFQVLLDAGEYQTLEDRLKKAISMRTEDAKAHDPAFFEKWLLAELYMRQKRFADVAHIVDDQFESILTEKLYCNEGSSSNAYLASMTWLVEDYLSAGQSEAAAKLAARILHLSEEHSGANSSNLIEPLRASARCSAAKNDHEAAADALKRALDIQVWNHGAGYITSGIRLEYASALRAMTQPAAADRVEAYHATSVTDALAQHGPSSEVLFGDRYGNRYHGGVLNKAYLRSAEEPLKQWLKVCAAFEGEGSLRTMQALSDLSKYYEQQKRFDLAEAMARRRLAILTLTEGKNCGYKRAPCLRELASIAVQQGQRAKALTWLRESHEAEATASITLKPVDLLNYATLYLQLGNTTSGVEYASRAAKLLSDTRTYSLFGLDQELTNCARLLKDAHQTQTSAALSDLAKRAIEIKEKRHIFESSRASVHFR